MRRAGQKGAAAPGAPQRSASAAFAAAFLAEGWELLAQGQDAEAMEVAKRVIRLQDSEKARRSSSNA